MAQRQWYRFEAKAGDKAADLYVYDAIGKSFWDDDTVTARKFIADLQALPDSIERLRVHVNSPGGDPFDATAIANALRQHKAAVDVSIEGLAASAATIITSAGDTIRIADNALLMVHNPWGFAMGEAKDLRSMADALDRIRDSIVATYRWKSQLSVEELQALMDAETWMGAEEAVANGFATEVVAGVEAAASLDPRAVAKLRIPEQYRARVEALVARRESAPPQDPPKPPAPAAAAEVLALVEAAGLSAGFARELVAAELPLDQVRAKVDRAREIKALCASAKLPELADGYIRGALPVADVKAHLTTITGKLDKAEVETGLHPDADARARARIDTAAVYRQWNQTVGAKGA